MWVEAERYTTHTAQEYTWLSHGLQVSVRSIQYEVAEKRMWNSVVVTEG